MQRLQMDEKSFHLLPDYFDEEVIVRKDIFNNCIYCTVSWNISFQKSHLDFVK